MKESNRKFTLVVLGCLCLLVAPRLSAASSFQDLLLRGDEAFAAGDFKKAARYFEKASKFGESAYAGLLGEGRSRFELGDWPGARVAARGAAEVGDDGSERAVANHLLGLVLRDHALEIGRSMREVLPSRSKNLAREGEKAAQIAKRARQQMRASAEAFRAATVEDPQAAAPWWGLTEVLIRFGDLREARVSLDRYLELAPSGAGVEEIDAYLECAAGVITELNETDTPLDDLVTVGDLVSGEDIDPPVRVHSPSPPYLDHSESGFVMVSLLIDKEGLSRCVRRADSVGLSVSTIASTLETVGTWKFKPASHKGEPVNLLYSVTISFKTSR